MENISINLGTITPQKIFKFILFTSLGILTIIILPYLKSIIMMLIVSLLLSYILEPFVNTIEGKGFSRIIAILIVFLVVALIFAFAFKFIIPAVINEAKSISEAIKTQEPQKYIKKIEIYFMKRYPAIDISQITGRFNQILSKVLQGSVSFIFNIFSLLTSLVIVPFITFFLIKDERKIKKGLISLVPNRYFEMSLILIYKIEQQLSRYIRGQLLDAMIVGLLSILGLYILKIKYFVFIGLIAGLANLIPYVGPIAGAVPAIIVSLINNPGNLLMIVWISLMFLIVQMIDNSLVSPMVVSKSVNLHPLVVIIAIIIGGNLMGAIGMLFAVPFTAILKVTIQEIMWGLKNYHFV